MVLSWSRAIYVEFVRRCLYDNAKVVILGPDEEGRAEWNQRMLDFALRVGFEIRLCQPYREQTKGKVGSRVKYVRGHMWPGMRFTGDADLNRRALAWCDAVATRRVRETTRRVPWEMLMEERPRLGRLPARGALAPYLQDDRRVARDGFVSWEGSRYGVHH